MIVKGKTFDTQPICIYFLTHFLICLGFRVLDFEFPTQWVSVDKCGDNRLEIVGIYNIIYCFRIDDAMETDKKADREEAKVHQKLGEGWVSGNVAPQRKTIFLGEYRHKIDDKGRLALPVKFRDKFKQGVVITRGLDSCLFVYAGDDWRVLAEKISKLPLTQTNARAFSRLMLAGASDANLDKQGRIILPPYLRQYAHLKNKVTIAGVYNRLEIWSRGKWGRYKKNAEENSSEIAEKLSDLGI